MANKQEEKVRPEQCFDRIGTKGRPKLKLNETGEAVVTNLASIMCTETEIAAVLGVSIETLRNEMNAETFFACYKKGQESGKKSLRRYQFDLAKTNATMAIWLGKQYLGQKDKTEVDMNTNIPSDGLFDALQKGLMNKDD